MSNAKEKHLELIQAVITRMAHCSFLIKGWAIAVAGVGFTFHESVKAKPQLIAPIGILILSLWGLDGFFLWQERRFRILYNKVRQKNDDEIDFSMEYPATNADMGKRCTWLKAVFSWTLLPFYGAILVSGVAFIFIAKMNF